MTRKYQILLATVLAVTIGACTHLSENLQTATAGSTGCQPQDNTIGNINARGLGFTWNATCKGRTYLCSTIKYGEATSCAPVAR